MLKFRSDVLISTYEIEFKYTTKRGNIKRLKIEMDSFPDIEECKSRFFVNIEKYNKSNQDKPFNDVEIINMTPLARNLYTKQKDGSFIINQVLD